MSDPNNPYGQEPDPNNPHGEPPAYGQQPPPYGESNPYGQQPPPYGASNPYGQPDPYGAATQHPQSTTILVLGILSIVCCQILGPVAWIMGNKAVKEIDANPGAYSGRETANIGRILGIIGTVLLAIGLVIAIIYIIAIIGVIATGVETSATYNGSSF